jgi:hypothetical protein
MALYLVELAITQIAWVIASICHSLNARLQGSRGVPMCRRQLLVRLRRERWWGCCGIALGESPLMPVRINRHHLRGRIEVANLIGRLPANLG